MFTNFSVLLFDTGKIVVLQVLRYGAERRIILQAADADANCVLACALAAAYVLTQQDGKQKHHSADFYLNAANCNLVISKAVLWLLGLIIWVFQKRFSSSSCFSF